MMASINSDYIERLNSNVYEDAMSNGVPPSPTLVNANPEVDEAQIDDFLGTNQDYNEEEEERKYFQRKRLGVIKNILAASIGGMLTYGVYLGLLQMQLILHYDETYREVKYGNMGLENIDSKMLMGINVTPVVALLYTPVLIRFLGTKWMMFLAVGIYSLFVSTNYWERYFTLVPSAVAIGVVIVPLWTSMGNYITRMAQKYYEFVNYKEEHVQEQKKPPKGAYNKYIIIFQSTFYFFFQLSFVCAQMPMLFFLNNYLYPYRHTLFNVKHCGSSAVGIISGFNNTVLKNLPRSMSLIIVESVLMGVAFLAMILILTLCGAAYRPTEEIDLRSIGWGNIFQLPFKHVRDYRLRHLFPFFVYSGFEVVFVCTEFALCYGVCSIGIENLAYIIITYGLASSLFSWLSLSMLRIHRQIPLLAGVGLQFLIIIGLFVWSPTPKNLSNQGWIYAVAALWGVGSVLNKTSLSTLIGMFYEDKERQDFIFTIYHWWQALAIFAVYLWSKLPMKAKLSILLVTQVIAIMSYIWMERKLALRVPFRIPKIPKPRHKVCGYRYIEDENSDESDSDRKEEEEEDALMDARDAHFDADVPRNRKKKMHVYEQAIDPEEETAQGEAA
ncbi:protein unc-93 homolog B1 [Latimeria chalumnae]|uniref:Unc-93 homolog B1, TLR signaling regulator n=1 Tax=Latimeria chalumnae TaxID=7897 RepID=H2ZRZ1_LATCH|nr:PREDICTED: protein unc-93 homolog B1 [Latimeria chalumnae]|eukprot:XP_014345863.1 PREDICTED: protein unc-93 homolog B1 [Latimeria chalumnae]